MKKSAQVANFNVVFGENELPMLECFDTIVFPAFSSGITKKMGDNELLFKNIEITQNEKNYVLTGKIVKKTVLEVKSDLNEKGELVEKDEKYSAAPYSTFVINLRNHRMIYMPNQKGSPSLACFRSVVKHVLDTYIRQENSKLEEGKKLDYAVANVVGIPSARSMDELLDNVEKVNSLTLKFYPLNGDMDYTEAFGLLSNDIRKELDSKTGAITYNSPKSIVGIKNILAKAAGTIEPVIKVITKGKSKATLKDYELAEKYEIDVDEKKDFKEETKQLVEKTSEIETLKFTNDKHDDIYNRNKGKIIPFTNGKR